MLRRWERGLGAQTELGCKLVRILLGNETGCLCLDKATATTYEERFSGSGERFLAVSRRACCEAGLATSCENYVR